MRHRGFLAWLLACVSLPVWGSEFEDPNVLHAGAQAFLEQSLMHEYAGVQPEHVKVTVAPIDSRLLLSRCSEALSHTIASNQPYGSNISLKLQCAGTKPWSIYLSAKVDTFAEVAVLSRSMNRGELITPGDVELIHMNTAQAGFGYIGQLDQVVGKELKRRLQAGTSLRLSHITAPEVVKKGDKVLLEAGTGGLSVVTSAKALAAGQIGEQIRVINSKSNREIDAIVIAPGRVKVLM